MLCVAIRSNLVATPKDESSSIIGIVLTQNSNFVSHLTSSLSLRLSPRLSLSPYSGQFCWLRTVHRLQRLPCLPIGQPEAIGARRFTPVDLVRGTVCTQHFLGALLTDQRAGSRSSLLLRPDRHGFLTDCRKFLFSLAFSLSRSLIVSVLMVVGMHLRQFLLVVYRDFLS